MLGVPGFAPETRNSSTIRSLQTLTAVSFIAVTRPAATQKLYPPISQPEHTPSVPGGLEKRRANPAMVADEKASKLMKTRTPSISRTSPRGIGRCPPLIAEDKDLNPVERSKAIETQFTG